MSLHTLTRDDTHYYRRRIPKAFAHLFPQRCELRLSLGKKSKMRAILDAKRLDLLFEELFMALRLDTSDDRQAIVDHYLDLMEWVKSEHARTDRKLVRSEDGSFTYIPVKQEQQSDKEPDMAELKEMLQKVMQVIDPKGDLQKDEPHSPTLPSKTGITFKGLYDLFLKVKRESMPDTALTTWRDYASAYDDFVYVIEGAGQRDIASFTKADIRAFTEALDEHLPSSRTKKPQYRELPYLKLKVITLAEEERMARNTKQKKISAIKQMFDIAIDPRFGYLTENVAQPFLLKGSRRHQSVTRKPLSDENLQRLFSSRTYTDKSIKTTRPERYWIPLIAIYTGMRQNEICQLHVEDVKKESMEDGEVIWYFDIDDRGTRHLKNDNAIRRMPLHPDLIRLGFIDYYNSIKDKEVRLWPNLRFHPKEQRYNTDYNKHFMKAFRREVTSDPSQVFHSMRHNVGGQLIKNTVRHRLPKELVNRLMGHEPDKDMTSRVYSQGYGIKELYEGIKTLEIDTLLL